MTARTRTPGDVVELRPVTPAGSERHPSRHRPTPMAAALDDLESAAREYGVLYVDVELQLALARHLAAIVGAITLGAEPTVAQVHAIRELRLATTELRQLVIGYAQRR